MWGGPGWYAALIELGERVYYLVADRDVNFGVGPTIRLCSRGSARVRFRHYDVEIYGPEMLTPFFRNWEAEYGLECARALFVDAAHDMNVRLAKLYLPRIREYASGHSRFTASDLYRDDRLNLYDIPMYLALAALVEAGELVGPNPYAHEPTGTMSELVYEVPMCRICGVVPAAPHDDLCTGCRGAMSVWDSVVADNYVPCDECTLDCDRGPEDHCPF
jgi:hypothetical protein